MGFRRQEGFFRGKRGARALGPTPASRPVYRVSLSVNCVISSSGGFSSTLPNPRTKPGHLGENGTISPGKHSITGKSQTFPSSFTKQEFYRAETVSFPGSSQSLAHGRAHTGGAPWYVANPAGVTLTAQFLSLVTQNGRCIFWEPRLANRLDWCSFLTKLSARECTQPNVYKQQLKQLCLPSAQPEVPRQGLL